MTSQLFSLIDSWPCQEGVKSLVQNASIVCLLFSWLSSSFNLVLEFSYRGAYKEGKPDLKDTVVTVERRRKAFKSERLMRSRTVMREME